MTWRTTWTGERQDLEAIDQILTELAEPPVDATSLIRDDDASAEPEDAPWLLHAYTEDKISQHILDMLPDGTAAPEQEELEDRDWVAHALTGLGIVRPGPFVLFGRHDAEEAEVLDGIKLQIEANQAFGTGHHPTTFGCLEALGNLSGTPTNILDIGTGSGVLAIAARKLYASTPIIATDIDQTSVDIAIENAGINGTNDLKFDTAAGTDCALTQSAAPFDLVFANILAGPLKELAPDIAAIAAPGATIILAGLLDEQRDGVIATYQDHGISVAAIGGEERWPILTLTKKTAS